MENMPVKVIIGRPLMKGQSLVKTNVAKHTINCVWFQTLNIRLLLLNIMNSNSNYSKDIAAGMVLHLVLKKNVIVVFSQVYK